MLFRVKAKMGPFSCRQRRGRPGRAYALVAGVEVGGECRLGVLRHYEGEGVGQLEVTSGTTQGVNKVSVG